MVVYQRASAVAQPSGWGGGSLEADPSRRDILVWIDADSVAAVAADHGQPATG